MKLRNIIPALLIAALAVLAGCAEDGATYLDSLSVSSSYVAFSEKDSVAEITVRAKGDWAFNRDEIPSWLTIAPVSGGAGETVVKFSASPFEGRSAELHINCGDEVQNINVIQGIAQVATATVAEVLAGPESKTYRVSGVVTSIAESATYGNFYINDGTSSTNLYIYGTLFNGQTKQGALLKLGIEVGDEVTVVGPKKIYNETVELVDVEVVKVNKSLIKVDSVSASELTSEGGDVAVVLDNKGDGVYVEVPEAAQSWLSIKSVAGNQVKFSVAPNNAGPRSATLVFKTVKDGKEYPTETTISQEGLSGTLAVPFTVEEAIAYIKKIGGKSTSDFYVKGKVSKIATAFGTKYGNGSFWLSDDGVFNDNLDLDFEAYQVYWFGNSMWTENNAQVSVGDEVVICGKLTQYVKNGTTTYETSGKEAYVYSVNGLVSDENGLGSLTSPFNTAGVKAAIDGGCKNNVYVKGKISKIKNEFSASYGTSIFWISDNGEYSNDDFEAYSVYYFDNKSWVEGNTQIALGDDVVLYGAVTKYNATYETSSKKAWIYSLNGKTQE